MSKDKIMYGHSFRTIRSTVVTANVGRKKRLIAKEEEEEGSNAYKTTERGMQFLELYKDSLRDLFLILHRTMVAEYMLTTPSCSPR